MLDLIKKIRERTGAGVVAIKKAIDEVGNDEEKIIEVLRKSGQSKAAKKAEREAKEGIVVSYVHSNNRVASLVKLLCETDFVAKNEDFRAFVHEIVLQVAAMKPEFISKDSIDEKTLEDLKGRYATEVEAEKKPKEMMEKIVQGKLNKFFSEKCLLEQKWFKDESKTISALLDEATQKMGEPLKISRILLWELGKE